MEIVGRDKEKEILRQCYESGKPELVAVYGRRRVGKTWLVRQFFNDSFDFYMTGVYLGSREEQLALFNKQLNKYSKSYFPVVGNWFDAFDQLKTYLSHSRKKRLVVFIDELPWLDTPRAGFLSALEHFWNGWGAGKHNLLLIVCGSATTWMLDSLINNKGGLYGRITREMHMHPFTLAETEAYFRKRGITMDRYDVVQTYMMMGGVAYYMSYFQPGRSLAQNIDELFFSENGFLQTEYSRLFTPLFADNVNYRKIVETLSGNRYGITREDISTATGIAMGGTLSNMLRALEKSDLITSYYSYGESKRKVYYRLSDMFCLFYLGFVQKNPTRNRSYWYDNQNSPKLNSWRGLAFEDVCFVHQNQIRAALGIYGVQAEIYPWHTTANGKVAGAQIDMLIDRADRVINLCEMKFTQGEFVIDKDYDEKLRERLATLTGKTKNRRNIQLTLVTTYGLKMNMYSNRIQRVILMDDLFKF